MRKIFQKHVQREKKDDLQETTETTESFINRVSYIANNIMADIDSKKVLIQYLDIDNAAIIILVDRDKLFCSKCAHRGSDEVCSKCKSSMNWEPKNFDIDKSELVYEFS